MQAEFSAFYEASRDECLRIVLLNVGDRALAEDLVAEGFARAWMSWRKVREHPAPRAWVIKTALNAHVSWWRRRRRETGLDNGTATRAGRAAEPTGADLPPSLDRSVVAALRRLPVRQRQVVTLRLLFDLDSESTARALGISGGTVASHLHRAIATLRGDAAFRNWHAPPDAGQLAGTSTLNRGENR